MDKIEYNKLVRDKIPHIIEEKGFDCEIRELSPEEHEHELLHKIYEEASGVVSHSDHKHLVEELADLEITLSALKQIKGITDEEIKNAIEKSLSDKGAYDKCFFLVWSSDTDYQSNEHTHKDK